MAAVLAFCDTPAAIEACRRLHPQAILASDNPLLAEAEAGIRDSSAFVGQADAKRLGEGIIDALLQLDRRFAASDIDRRFGLLTSRLNLTIALRGAAASLLIRGVMAAQMLAEAGEGIAKVVLAGAPSERWPAAHPWSLPRFGLAAEILARHGFFGSLPLERLPVAVTAPEQVGDVPTDDLLSRLMITPLPLLAYEAGRRLRLDRLARGQHLYVGKSAESLREAIPWLTIRGFRPLPFRMPGYAPVAHPPGDARLPVDPWLDVEARPVLEAAVAEVFSAHQRAAYAGAILEHMQAGLQSTAGSIPQLNRLLEEIAARSPGAAILTGGIYGPLATNFHHAAKSHGVKIVDFEHGATTGIARTAQRRLAVSEATTCDLLVVGSPRAARVFATVNAGLDIVVAGLPDQTRHVLRRPLQRWRARRRLGIGNAEPVALHVSGFVFGGNVRFGDDGPVEAVVLGSEKRLLQEAYADLPWRVLYKPYPAIRMLYQPEPDRRIRLAPNISVVPREDFRYIRAAADVIITEASMSTLGWCLGTRLPFVHLQSQDVNLLADETLRRGFAESFFVIDMDAADWPQALRRLLERPVAELRDEWRAKEKYRREFVMDAFEAPSGCMGRSAAAGIADYLTQQGRANNQATAR